MSGIWRVDRAGEPPEFYGNETIAKAREAYLKLRGVTFVVAWFSAESVGPVVAEQKVAS